MQQLSANLTDRDLWFAIIGAVLAYASVCVVIWPMAGCVARFSFRRGPRLARIEKGHADADH